jgi:hypothetical protein
MPADNEYEDGYRGPATLSVDGAELVVKVDLRGYFQPIDGYYRWYGRISRHEQLDELLKGRKRRAQLRTPQGSAVGELSDPDPWGRYRVLGTSTPPFHPPA